MIKEELLPHRGEEGAWTFPQGPGRKRRLMKGDERQIFQEPTKESLPCQGPSEINVEWIPALWGGNWVELEEGG